MLTCAHTHTEKKTKNTAYKEHNTHWEHETMCVCVVRFLLRLLLSSKSSLLLPPSSSPSGHLCTACYPLA